MILKYGSLYFPKVREHNSFPVGNQQSGIRQLFLDMIRFQTAFRSTVASAIPVKPASHLCLHSSEPSFSPFQRAISVFIPASHLFPHSSEPSLSSFQRAGKIFQHSTIPVQYHYIAVPTVKGPDVG